MFNTTRETITLTDFAREPSRFLDILRETGEPIVLSVDGTFRVVIDDAETYQELVEAAAKVDEWETVGGISEGAADADAGRTKPARLALRELAEKYGLDKD